MAASINRKPDIHRMGIVVLMLLCSLFYYMDVQIDWTGLYFLRWSIFFTVHDLHRALFLIPILYAAYLFRVKGTVITNSSMLMIILPRALFISPYPDPLLRALIFGIAAFSISLLMSLLLNSKSERKRLERDLLRSQNDALRETRDYLRSLIGYANAPIIAWNNEQKITIFNSAFERLTGYAAREVLDQPIEMLFPQSSKGEALLRIKHALTGKQWESEEIAVRHKDGGIRIILWNSANIYDKYGTTLLATIAQGQDITDRKQTEEKLRESEDRFKYFFENSVVGKSITLPDGQVNVNAAFRNMLGYSDAEMQNLSWRNITHPDDIEMTQQAIDRILAGQSDSLHLTKRFIHRSGEIVWADLSSSLRRNPDGRPLYFITVAIDITKRKKVEQQREAALDEIRRLNENLEKTVEGRTEELRQTIHQLEEINRIFVNRELKMIELKQQIVEMRGKKSAGKMFS